MNASGAIEVNPSALGRPSKAVNVSAFVDPGTGAVRVVIDAGERADLDVEVNDGEVLTLRSGVPVTGRRAA